MHSTHFDAQASTARLERFDPLDSGSWAGGEPSRDSQTAFMAIAWQQVLVDTYGFEPNCLAYYNGEAKPTLLPFTVVQSWLTGKRAVSLPFLDDCPMIEATQDALPNFLAKLIEIGKAEGWRNIILKGGVGQLPSKVASTIYYGHRIPLDAAPETLFDSFRSCTRRAIRKAEKSGVTVEMGTQESLVKDYYYLQCLTRKRHGLPPQTYRFFRNIQRRILETGRGQTVICRYEGRPVAGAVFFHHEDQAFFKFGASDMRYQHVRGNNLCMWTAIKHYAERGYKELNLGRTAPSNEGLRFFKLGWGTIEDKVYYFCYDLEKDAFVSRPEKEAGWHNSIFSTIPIWASRLAGWMLYRHMA